MDSVLSSFLVFSQRTGRVPVPPSYSYISDKLACRCRVPLCALFSRIFQRILCIDTDKLAYIHISILTRNVCLEMNLIVMIQINEICGHLSSHRRKQQYWLSIHERLVFRVYTNSCGRNQLVLLPRIYALQSQQGVARTRPVTGCDVSRSIVPVSLLRCSGFCAFSSVYSSVPQPNLVVIRNLLSTCLCGNLRKVRNQPV